MTYTETVDYLFRSAPLFQQQGGAAYKEGLSTTLALDAHFSHPHRRFRTIHVAGTNGKGSVASTLAAILQTAGYRVGLYTSPHLVDFRERIRVNGEMISEDAVVRFVADERSFFEPLHPSFFELTTALAFKYFAEQRVDVAVIEVGLGGRLDCTNIIKPELSIITNISFDHTQFLGNTLAAIAHEKAGIIKPDVPVVIGEATPETRPVFDAQARVVGAPITFAEDAPVVERAETITPDGFAHYEVEGFGALEAALTGDCQVKNVNTIFAALRLLKGFDISEEAIRKGFHDVRQLSGLRGRWEQLREVPRVVCDTGHNPGGWSYLAPRLSALAADPHTTCLRIVFGMAADKDIDTVMSQLPCSAEYYFTQASVHRAMSAEDVKQHGERHGLQGRAYPEGVAAAYRAALADAAPTDFIFVGGSCFVVADLLAERG